MDKNQVIGLLLMGLLFFVWIKFFSPEPPEADPVTEQGTETTDNVTNPPNNDTFRKLEDPVDTMVVSSEDSAGLARLQKDYGLFAAAASGESEQVTVENELIRMVFNTRGGIVQLVELKEFKTYQKNPLILFDDKSSTISYLAATGNQTVDLAELYYQPQKSTMGREGDTTLLSFTADLGNGNSISHHYVIPSNSYEIGYRLETNGLQRLGVNNINLKWRDRMKAQEKDITESRNRTTITYYLANGNFESLKESSIEKEEETIEEGIKWIAFKQKFFTSAIIAEDPFDEGMVQTTVDVDDSTTVKEGLISVQIDLNDAPSQAFTLYFGPNNYQIMKKVTDEFSENIYLGWPPISYVNKFLIIPIFQFLEDYIGNYGVIIFILVIIIRIILFPLSYKSHVSMAKTRILKPEIDALKEKHGGDMQKMQADQMQLYQKAGVNPLSGCIPMLLQMPILFAMFYFFPNSIELRQEAFLWADDLSTYDSFITFGSPIPLLGNHLSLFTVLMTISTIGYTWMNNQVTAVSGPMKNIGYVMPVVFLFVLNSFSSALTYYYFLSNIFSFAQQAVIKRFVNDEKLKKIMDENKLKNKNKKKSMFQARLEEAMKAQKEVKGKNKK